MMNEASRIAYNNIKPKISKLQDEALFEIYKWIKIHKVLPTPTDVFDAQQEAYLIRLVRISFSEGIKYSQTHNKVPTPVTLIAKTEKPTFTKINTFHVRVKELDELGLIIRLRNLDEQRSRGDLIKITERGYKYLNKVPIELKE